MLKLGNFEYVYMQEDLYDTFTSIITIITTRDNYIVGKAYHIIDMMTSVEIIFLRDIHLDELITYCYKRLLGTLSR